MAVKSKTQKSNSFIMLGGKKGGPKKQQQQEPEEEDSDMLDSEAEEDDDEMELEDDESIAPEDDDSDVDEGEESDEAPAQVPAKGNKQQGKANNTPTKANNTPTKANKAGKVAPAKASPKVGGSPNDTQSKQSISDRQARTVCVKHLKPTSTDEHVVEFFAGVGKCKLVRRVRSKGLAIVMFDNAGQVEKALRKSGEALNGHPVVVERSKFGSASLEAYKAKKKLRTKERREARRLKAKQQTAGVKDGAGQQKKKQQQSKPAAATAASPVKKSPAASSVKKSPAASPVKKSPAKNQKQRQQKGKAGGAKPNANKQQAPKGKKEKK